MFKFRIKGAVSQVHWSKDCRQFHTAGAAATHQNDNDKQTDDSYCNRRATSCQGYFAAATRTDAAECWL